MCRLQLTLALCICPLYWVIFLAQFPDVSVNLELDNRYIEMISEGYDAAIRVGEMEDSSLRARKIAETTIRMVACPRYLQRAARPRRIEDLGSINCCITPIRQMVRFGK